MVVSLISDLPMIILQVKTHLSSFDALYNTYFEKLWIFQHTWTMENGDWWVRSLTNNKNFRNIVAYSRHSSSSISNQLYTHKENVSRSHILPESTTVSKCNFQNFSLKHNRTLFEPYSILSLQYRPPFSSHLYHDSYGILSACARYEREDRISWEIIHLSICRHLCFRM